MATASATRSQSDSAHLSVVDPDDLPSTAPGDLGDFERFASAASAGLRTSVAVICTVGRPGKLDYFRTSQDDKLYRDFSILEFAADGGNRLQYLIDPSLCGLPELRSRTGLKQLVPFITLNGGLGLWPISVENDDNTWVKSARNIVIEARSRWVAAIPYRATGAYQLLPASGQHPDPEWALKTLPEWLNLAFPRERRIEDRDHPVMMKLRAE